MFCNIPVILTGIVYANIHIAVLIMFKWITFILKIHSLRPQLSHLSYERATASDYYYY